jgi:hypothetical protein
MPRIIVNEARRRGIAVEVLDAEAGYFALTLGGRTIDLPRVLSELTSAVAMSRCDDKAVTRRCCARRPAVPEQIGRGAATIRPTWPSSTSTARGGQAGARRAGRGISVDVRDPDELRARPSPRAAGLRQVLLEEFVEGRTCASSSSDKVVAAAIRRPAQVIGTASTASAS